MIPQYYFLVTKVAWVQVPLSSIFFVFSLYILGSLPFMKRKRRDVEKFMVGNVGSGNLPGCRKLWGGTSAEI